ncbi:MAG: GGDEF domain-containing protein [Alphaproteobacteria bacterium]|nr:GGDEF domain-containing protein [Alphaproteobacteria bacterium]
MGKPVKDAMAALGIPEAELTPRVREVIAGLTSEVGHLRARLESLETVADQDSLLPILNRRAFVREIARLMAFGERYDLTSSLVYFDLDDLKTINDTDGHAAGDAALRHVAGLLAGNVRKSDVVGRLGGDEFGVILPKADSLAADKKARVLVKLLAGQPLLWAGKLRTLNVSFGIHTFAKGDDAEKAIAAADKAMYAAKRAK